MSSGEGVLSSERAHFVRTDAHGDTVNKLVDSLYLRPSLHLAPIIAAHFVAPALDIEVRGHLLVRVEALAAVGEEACHKLAQHLPHEQRLLPVGVVVELSVALVQDVLDREPAALEVRRDVVGLPVEVVVGILDEIVRLGPREPYDRYDDAWHECGARCGIQRERLEPVWLETPVDEVVCCERTLAGDLDLVRGMFENS